MKLDYIAHIRASDGCKQSVEQHLLGVKALAEEYGAKIGVRHIAGLAGMLHDMGKYTDTFRNYLIQAVQHPEAPPKRGSVDHSTAGGKLLYERYHNKDFAPIQLETGLLAEIVGNAIISHHSYLHDYLDQELESKYLQRVTKQEGIFDFEKSVALLFEDVISEQEFKEYIARAANELKDYLNVPSAFTREQKCMFLTKFVFSALIDADRTDTRRFEENLTAEMEASPAHSELFQDYYDKLMQEIYSYDQNPLSENSINNLRKAMSEQCDRFATKPSGIYTLSIPTGGGKTLASLRYALKHAAEFGKKRIIYVLPYTTIIEQNAAEVRRILQDDVHILEHHSNVVEENFTDDEAEEGVPNVQQKLKLSKDNWDSPIIFTTMVQFLNVFYAKGSRNIRRLHNLAESVLIFDEVQKVPISCISLFNEALNFLHGFCRSSIILCTATQPALDFVEHRLQIQPEAEMISNLEQVVAAFKRVEMVDEATSGPHTNESLTEFVLHQLEEKPNILIILNTKSVVKKLSESLREKVPEGVPVYHLSTSMCPAHRKKMLAQIRVHLLKKERMICISTALIEAGVDVSFSCVIRSLAGLDSIAQAAGRCNRHGEDELQQVYVIDHAEENLKYLEEVRRGKEITKRILLDLKRTPGSHGGHLLSLQAMTDYFRQFYTDMERKVNYNIKSLSLDMTTLLFAAGTENKFHNDYYTNYRKTLPLFLRNSYRTAAEYFQVIDQPTTSVIVPYGEEGNQIIAELNGAERIEDFGKLMRRAQQYSISLFRYDLDKLSQNDALESLLDGRVFVLKDGAYNEEYGLDLGNDSWSGSYMW